MFPFVFLLFAIPLFEAWLLIRAGGSIGAMPTIALVVFTAVVGGYLVRQQGISTLMKIQRAQQAGEMPAAAMVEGMAIMLAGALLITPGFFTDLIGFCCLWPWFRRQLAKQVLRRVKLQPMAGGFAGTANWPGADDSVIDAEYRDVSGQHGQRSNDDPAILLGSQRRANAAVDDAEIVDEAKDGKPQ